MDFVGGGGYSFISYDNQRCTSKEVTAGGSLLGTVSDR